MPCLWVFVGGETCGGSGSCSGGYFLCLWVKIECLRGGLVVEIVVGLWWRKGWQKVPDPRVPSPTRP